MVEVKVGDRVMVSWPYRTSNKWATVTEVARIWITAQPDGSLPPVRLRKDDQTDGKDGSIGVRFYTVAQWDALLRQKAARKVLTEHGIGIQYGSPWSGHAAELAEVLTKIGIPTST